MDFGLKAEPLHNNVQGVFTLHNTGHWFRVALTYRCQLRKTLVNFLVGGLTKLPPSLRPW